MSEKLKKEISKLEMELRERKEKIKEYSKEADRGGFQQILSQITNKIEGKHAFNEPFPQVSFSEGTENDKFLLPFKYVTLSLPLMMKQQQLDSNAITIISLLEGIRENLGKAEEALKEGKLSICTKPYFEIDRLFGVLKANYDNIYEKLKITGELKQRRKILREKLNQGVKEKMKKIAIFTAKDVVILDCILFCVIFISARGRTKK